jgi:pimeloyl-ACP methyl ester carboxylesterase
MTWIRRGWFTWLDYWLAGWWGLRVVWMRHPPADWQRGDRDPVLLLPGVYESWVFLRALGDRLNAEGHPVHVVSDLGRNIDTIPEAASVAQRTIERLGLQRVALVAHSKGGLIGKHMMAVDDTAHRIASLTTIGTPFAGSSMARYMLNRPLRAFLPTDSVITRLAAERALNARVTAIFAEFDAHIPEQRGLEGATNVRLPVIGHFRPLQHPLALDAVVEAVRRNGATGSPGME